MKSISLFEDKHSFLNGLSAKTKLAYIICATSTPSLLGGYSSFAIFIILSLILLATSRILAKIKIVIQVTGFIIVTIFIVQTFFRSGNYTILFKLGPLIARKEGFEVAMKIVLNVLNISFAFCVLTLTTKPSDMMQEMTRAGLPPKMGYVFVSLFQIIPQITQQTSTIVDAQRSRGLKTKGSLITRFKAFLPLISPIIMSSFMSSKERTIALEVRGFSCNNQKTFIKPFKPSKYNTLFLCACLIVIIASIIYALLHNLGYIAWQLFI